MLDCQLWGVLCIRHIKMWKIRSSVVFHLLWEARGSSNFWKIQNSLQDIFRLRALFVTFQKDVSNANRYLETSWKLSLSRKKKFLLWRHHKEWIFLENALKFLLKILLEGVSYIFNWLSFPILKHISYDYKGLFWLNFQVILFSFSQVKG